MLTHLRFAPSLVSPLTYSFPSSNAFRYAALSAATVILYFGLNAKPESSGVEWAKEEAKKRLAAKQ